MNYIGSKLRLSKWIQDEIIKTVGENLQDRVFCDIFAGTGAVAKLFKNRVKRVIANDIEYYSFVLNRNYIGNNKNIEDKKRYIEKLNALSTRDDGFVYLNYCEGGGNKRLYFSDDNGKKIDVVRKEIERYKDDEDLYYFLLASLIESVDRVANTASIYGSFLKRLKKTALKPFLLEPAVYEESGNVHEVFQCDANELIKKIKGDILYLDPPYNHRQYGANYHILNTIAEYKKFEPRGKSGLRDYYKSSYCKRNLVKKCMRDLIENAEFKYIFLSYNNEGLMSKDDIEDILRDYGEYSLSVKKYKRFKADKTEKRKHKADLTYEYLHILIKDL